MKLPYPLILASTSKYRANLLTQLGWPFECVAPGVDEEKIKEQGFLPLELAGELSGMKAQSVFLRQPDACVIGSDQVCTLDQQIFGKPHTIDEACAQISQMQGRSHMLHTAVTVMCPKATISFTNTTILHMRKLSLAEIRNYVLSDKPLDCAGSYKLEEKGIKLFERIDMDDHTSIIGLPLIQLTNTLLKLGYPLS